jgi:hypothetical protein
VFWILYYESGFFGDLSRSASLGFFIGQHLAAWGVPFSLAEESFGFLEEQDLVVFEYEAYSPLDRQGPEELKRVSSV